MCEGYGSCIVEAITSVATFSDALESSRDSCVYHGITTNAVQFCEIFNSIYELLKYNYPAVKAVETFFINCGNVQYGFEIICGFAKNETLSKKTSDL